MANFCLAERCPESMASLWAGPVEKGPGLQIPRNEKKEAPEKANFRGFFF
jgi:hypothetical protein